MSIFILFDHTISHHIRLRLTIVMLRAVLKFNCFYCNGDCYFVIHFIRRPQIKNSLKRNSASLGCKFQGRAQGSSSQPSELKLNHPPVIPSGYDTYFVGHTVHYRTIAMTRLTLWWRWHVDDGAITMKRWSIAPSISRIASSHHRAIYFFAHALFEENGDRITYSSITNLIKHPACLY